MRVVDLPPDDYNANENVFGPWFELWVVTQSEVAVRLRSGWLVEIGRGVTGKERPLLSVRAVDQVVEVPTKGHSRLSFRARRSRSDVGR
jgi:hypothetical protein